MNDQLIFKFERFKVSDISCFYKQAIVIRCNSVLSKSDPGTTIF